MSEQETRFRVSICDASIDFEGRIDSREEIAELIARLEHAADYVWPQGAGRKVSCETRGPVGAMCGDELASLVTRQLTNDERARLSPRQAQAVALRRSGETLERAAAAMGLSTSTGVVNLVNMARQRGVEVGSPRDGEHHAGAQGEEDGDDAPADDLAAISGQRIEEIVAEQLRDEEFASLKPRHAEAVALRRYGLNQSQTAYLMGITPDGVQYNLKEARARGVDVRRRACA